MADLKISALTASTTPLAGTEVLPIVQSSTTKQVSVANLTAGRAVSASSVSTTGNSTFNTTANIGWRVGARSDNAISAIYSTSVTPSSTNYALQASSTVTYVNSPGTVSLAVSDTAIATASSTGLTLPSGNLIIGTSGKGIDFSATPGTGTSELLADYEEGTWTPTVGGTWTVTPTFFGTATYTKIGRSVTVNFAFLAGTKATTFGGYFDGLPYNVGATATGAVVDNNIVNRGLAEVTSTARVWVTDLSFPDVNFVTVTYFV